jgi:hypothetical protein
MPKKKIHYQQAVFLTFPWAGTFNAHQAGGDGRPGMIIL